jgi:hypothetical protein
MRIPASYVCSLPDFDETVVGIEASDPREAAEFAAAWWERKFDDFRVIQGKHTLRVLVQIGDESSWWDVMGEIGKYVAKPMRSEAPGREG